MLGIQIQKEWGNRRSQCTLALSSPESHLTLDKGQLFHQVSTSGLISWDQTNKPEDETKSKLKKRSSKVVPLCVWLQTLLCLWTFFSLALLLPHAAACRQSKESKMNKTKLKAIIVWEQSSYLHDSVCLLLPYRPQGELDKDLVSSEPHRLLSLQWGDQMKTWPTKNKEK